jgi:predicted kinase
MPKVLFCKGIPASGKSTYAKKLAEDFNWKRVNRDDLRAMADNGKFSGKNEKLVTKLQYSMIIGALDEGYNVVVDDTNLNPKTIPSIKKAISDAEIEDVQYETKMFEVSVEEAIKRDAKRANGVGHEVIWRFANNYLMDRKDMRAQAGTTGSDLPLYLCDIDGTLAKMKKRKPFEWSRVGEDSYREDIADIIADLKSAGNVIYLFSGRDSVCRSETEKWLDEHQICYDGLFMRPEGDNRKDTIVKREMFDTHVAGKGFIVKGVFDDRPVMCRMYKQMGITVFNCDDRVYPLEF